MSQPNTAYSSLQLPPVRPESLRSAATWSKPTPEEITSALTRAGIKWDELAAISGHPDMTVAKWHDGSESIEYMTWRFICERAGYGQIELNQY